MRVKSRRYPYAPIKVTGAVYEINGNWVTAKLWVDRDEFFGEIKLSAFGDDAARLREGTLITCPARRPRQWKVMPIPRRTPAQMRRIRIEAEIWAKQIRKLFNHNPEPSGPR